MVPLYDNKNYRWNWVLPKSHHESSIIQLPDLEEDEDGKESGEATKSGSGGTQSAENPSTQEHPSEGDTTNKDTSKKPHMLEDIFLSFFNATCATVAKRKQNKVMAANSRAVVCTWSAWNSTCPVEDQEVSQKPDLALLDNVQAWWDMIKAVCKLMSQLYKTTGTIAKMIDSKAYLLLRCQPWRRFVLLFSLTNEYCKFSQKDATGPKMIIDTPESDSEIDLDMETNSNSSSHSKQNAPINTPQLKIPEDPLHTSFMDPIGRIIVNNHTYDILEVISSSQGLVGHGMVFYLARRGNVEYIIKDH
ncbi:hypothetical protein BDR06DRAFT_967894 [Suillus hirtellus]|nr:hypothetical protein BDR06DRAFT_967894 [Suillus hirtellus]